MKKIISILIIVFFGQCIMAQSVVHLEGKFQGPNLYMQNPLNGDNWCVDSIKVNRKKLTADLSMAAVEIKLKDLDLNLGDEVMIDIYHQKDCKPKILNNNTTPKKPFTLNVIELSSDGYLSWEAISEDSLRFEIEQFRWNKWIKVGSLNAKGLGKSYHYKYKVSYHSGLNKFRIKQIDAFGKPHYSKGIRITPNVKENSMVCTRHKNDITFVNETTYEIYDAEGKKVLSGHAKIVDLKTLKKGIYYINYDNKTDTFIKR